MIRARWMFRGGRGWSLATAMVVFLGSLAAASAQSHAPGRVLVEERFESGDDTSRKRFLGPSFNTPDTWELRDGAVASIYDHSKKKGHGAPISARCRARDIRVSYRVRFDSDTSAISVIVDGDWPNKTGLPLWHIGDVNAAIAADADKPDVSIWERRFTRDMNDPRVKIKEWKPHGLLTDMNVLAPAYFGIGNAAERKHVGLRPGQWYRIVFEIIAHQWTMWVDGEQVLTMTQPVSDCDKAQVCFLGFGPLLLDDIVVEELPQPTFVDLVIVAGGAAAARTPLLAEDMPASTDGDRRLTVLEVAVDGSSLQKGWDPFSNGAGGECYRVLHEKLCAQIRAGREQGQAIRPRALVFLPEDDALAADEADAFRERLINFVKAFRGDLSSQKIAVVLAGTTGDGSAPTLSSLRGQVAEQLPRCVAVELPPAGGRDAGRRCVAAILEAEKE